MKILIRALGVLVILFVWNSNLIRIMPASKLQIDFKGYHKTLPFFLDELGRQESNNTYDTISIYGFLGKYQFSKKTLESLGISANIYTFLESPILQEDAMLRLLEANRLTLHKVIHRYDGTLVRGTRISESGILAAAHLVGPSGVSNFFKYGTESRDRNGMSLIRYMKKFSGYKI